MSAAAGTGRFFRASRERLDLLRERRREEGLGTTEVPALPRRRDPSVHPLSFSQERLWFLDRLDPERPAWNIPASLRLRGPLNVGALARALTEVVRRHEALRATFHDDGGRPLQRIAPAFPVPLPVIDLRTLPPGQSDEEARRVAAREASRPFRLGAGPLIRARLLQLGEEEHALGLEAHHIVADGWSLGVLVRELTALYAGETLPELPIQYADYAAWQRERLTGEALEEQIAWWRERLAGSPPSLDLPTDRSRPAVQTFHGGHATCWLPAALTDRLRSLAGGAGASLFMVLLAAVQLLLARWSGQEDVPVGSPIAGRTRREVEGLIGIFLNHLVLRTDLSGDLAFRELLGRVREVAVGAYAHQDLPFEKLLAELEPQRDLSRTPLFQVFFNLLSFPTSAVRLPGLTVEALDAASEPQSKFDLTFYLAEQEGGLRIDLVYNADLFDAARMDEALAQYRLLLEQAADDPAARIGSYSLVTDAARGVLPDPMEDLDASWPGSVTDALARHARATPDRPAVLWEGGELSYLQLDREVDRVASDLRKAGIGRGEVVTIWGHRSALLVPEILGVLRAGAAFVILDPAYPEQRNAKILELAKGQGFRPPAGAGEGGDLAYIAFTSGSTGVPKGVLGLHRSLTHFYPWMSQAFQLGPEDRFSLLSGLAHDPLHRDVFTPLWLGAAVVIPDPDRMAEPGWLAGWMTRTGVTVAHLTPALGRLLTEAPSGSLIPSLRRAFFVGDVLTRRDVERLRALAPEVACVNLYGSTETQRAVGYHRVEKGAAREVYPLGRGMPDVQLLVLTPAGLQAGIGEAGEVCVRSPHLAAGYLGDPDLTARRFVTNPFTGREGDRLYRTGDLGRYRLDGEVEPLGRADLQVKIRGFRVELGEIEAALARHPAIREAVVVARGSAEDRGLVAYAVPEGGAPGSRELRDFLRARLPDYMIPAAFVFLDALPLTPNRKVDRKALPEPGREEPREAAAPWTPIEELLAAVWSEVLATDRIGPEDDFFALGGHSLRITQVLARVREICGVELPVRSVFESSTLAGLAARIEEALRTGASAAAPPLVRVPRGGSLSMSFAQERLWFLDRLFPGSPAYNMPAALRLSGALDPAALERTLREIVRRHEALRTTFLEVDGEPCQRVHPFRPFLLPLADLRGLPQSAREAEAERIVRTEAARPFDLLSGPLLRAALLRLDERDWVALLCTHHIVSDGWSVGVLVREIADLSRGATLPELPVQYADFAVWQRGWLQGEVLETQVAFWLAALEGAPAVLDLPLDRPRSPGAGRAGVRTLVLPPDLSVALHELGRRAGATLFMVLLAAFQALLHRLTGGDDLVVGTPIANRTHPGLEGLIGFFVNTLALRSRLDEADPGFGELLGRTRAVALAAYAHQDLPFEKLVEELRVERSLHHAPIFQVLLVLQNAPMAALELPGLTLGPVPLPPGVAKFDLSLSFVEAGSAIHAALDYDAGLFDATTAARLLERLGALFRGIAAHPERRLSGLPVMSEAERHQVAEEWSDTTESFSLGTLHGLFLAQAERSPEAVALVFEGRPVTYGELAESSGRLAARLRELEIGPEVRVAVSLPRSPELVVTILAILQAGGAYVPLDPEDPPERRAWIAADCGAALVITQEGVEAGETPAVPGGGLPESLAYVIYTSGTTGRPKGAMVPHRAAVNHILWAQAAYGLGPGDAGLLKTPIGFDVSVRELFWPLSVGARVVIARPGGERDPGYLLDLIGREGVTVASFVPSLLAAVLDRKPAPGLQRVIAGGEALSAELAERCFQRLPGASLHNHYGPTETAVNATAWRCRPGERPVPIGRPIANVRIDLLDAWGSPVPIGMAGEVHVGGSGVGRGYLGRLELTAERFVPDPRESGARQYRTGDLARWRPDGALEFLGRRDHQVKVRGLRVEPEEVEAVLSAIAGVREAAVVDRDGALVAYVAAAAQEIGALRTALAARLPVFLIPSAFVPVEALPRTPRGKVDRRALAQREIQAAVLPEAGFEPPRTPVEEQVAEVWSEVLGRPRIGAHDDFFALGGHSLLALQVAGRLREAFGVEVPLRRLFEAPTLAALAREVEAALLAGAGSRPAPPLVRVPRDREIPLSFFQESLWLVHQLDPASPAYNIPTAVRVSGRLDPAALERTLREIVRRHEALRTTFPGGRPVQAIHPPRPVLLPRIDLGGLPPGLQETEVRRLAREEALRPFDLARGPLLRAALARLGEEEHLFLLTLHHAVSDEWSVAALVREVGAIYPALTAGLPVPLPELPVQVADHAVWQREWLRGEVLEERLAWWREQLAGAPPVIELPLDRPRTAARSFRGGRVPLEIPAETAERLRRLGRGRTASLFMVLLAGSQAWLGRHGAGLDLVVGAPVANRSHPGTEGLIGFLVNTLPLRGDLAGDPGFGELVERSREACLGALARQDLPFERLVRELRPERSLAHAPLFQVMLSLHNVAAPVLDLPGLSFRPLEMGPGTAKFDLVLELREGPGATPAVLGALGYAADLFDRATAERLAGHLRVLLETAAADPERPFAALPLLTPSEARQIAEWSAARTTFPSACLHRLFESRAAERPGAVAVTGGGERLTYAELDQQANRLARRLRALGVGPETRVALRHGRTPGLIVGLLGILKAGGAYVPIDPAWPAERQRLLLEDAGAPVLVDEEMLAAAQEESDGPLDVPVVPENLAYVIYTSGSTGRPKGTLVTHANVSRLLAATDAWFEFGPDDVWTLFHSAAFDFSVWEIWGALASGGRLVVVPTEVTRSPEDLWSLLEAEGVTVLNQTPSVFRFLVRLPVPESLRWVIFGGEALDVGALAGWLGGPRLVNMYGITETTVHVTWRPLSGDDLKAPWRSPIGVPIPDLSVHILDRRGAPVPAGVSGEICVGGAGLARGYLGRPDQTAERFVPDLFGERLYRSGDLARRLPSGELEYLGRIDQQVKLRGFRIEPAEIEAALTAVPGVREAAVLLRDDLPGGPGLVAYVVGGPTAGDLLAALRSRLPDPMVPGHFVFLPALPLTPNGKLDRRALPAPGGGRPDLARAYVAPRTPLERVLAGAWEEALGVDRVGVEDGFFDLGGHSLLATQMISWVRETFDLELPLRELFERPTVAGLAAALARDPAVRHRMERTAELLLTVSEMSEEEVAGRVRGAERA
jgi:amino acid adenylation domain-containing protein